ncbi:TfoX/Sxy family protein [Microvirga guangxiensis]|uniref:DNA transformation protein n=1 Tax=Microvirga guangxiensis TaxID=549386 RepID=A0A1G5ITF4_9HYPH|nr:TfoX/Sxy family protein [Microvirga guangxiensis]SCY79020.1 DNA transformation protein [Microvirga guangxiensis]
MDAEAIREILSTFGPVQIRRMFGGQGIYRDGLMFALEASGELYLKADRESEGRFRELGSRPFAYAAKDGRTTVMSYWLMPESALDDPDEAAELARMAFHAALRAKAAKLQKTKKPSPARKARKSVSEPAL